MSRFQFIWQHLKGQRLLLSAVILATIGYAAINLFASLSFSFVIDNVINDAPLQNVFTKTIAQLLGGVHYCQENPWILAIFLIIVYALVALLMSFRQVYQGAVSENLVENLRNHLYSHIQRLPYAYHVQTNTGELIQKCTSDVDMIRRFFAGQLAEIFYIFFTALIALIVLFTLNVKLALFASVSLPIIFLYSYWFFNKVQKQFLLSDEAEAEMTTKVQESLSGVRVVKAFNREKYEVDQFDKVSKNYKDVTYHMISFLGSYWASSYVVVLLGILSVLIAGVFAVQSGNLSVGNFVVFVEYQSLVLYPVRQLGRILSDFGKMGVSIDRLKDIIETPQEDLISGISDDLDGDIVFDHVGFAYADDNQQVLNDISFTIEKGKTVSIIGPTGSGKSTLMYLLTRLYDPSNGSITFNGHDSLTINRQALRNHVGIVLQEPFLFSKSIMDNLKAVNPNADPLAITQATRIASVHDVIETFDQQYNTIVGEKGVTLSGGQKQRIAIARTLLKDSDVLVFDDSLSAVDTQTDEKIRNALHVLGKQKTMIIITQRISSAKDSDLIIVLDKGSVAQMGTHEQLLQQDGIYSRVAAIQTRMKA